MQTEGITISPVNMAERQKIDIRAGDTVRVWVKVEEKGKTRLQPFEGTVLARKHGNEPGATFTVRRVSGGYGVEKIFPLYSPNIDKIEITKRARVRKSKVYHIRDKAAREIRRQMRNMRFVNIATTSDIEDQAKEESADVAEGNTEEKKEEKQEEAKPENKQEKKEEAKQDIPEDKPEGEEDTKETEEKKESE